MQAGIALAASKIRVVKVLQDRKAFDETTGVSPEEAKINFKYTLKLMEEGGLIKRTSDGRIYLTEKGQKTKH
jgi:repressor of nif and glnA expression